MNNAANAFHVATPAETAAAIRKVLEAKYAGIVIEVDHKDVSAFFAGRTDILNVIVMGDGSTVAAQVLGEVHLSVAKKGGRVSVGMATPKISYLSGMSATAIMSLGRFLGDVQKVAAGNRVY